MSAEVDPAIVAVLRSLVGIYPVGALVRLANGAIGVVEAPSPDPARPEAPIVRVLVSDRAGSIAAGDVIDPSSGTAIESELPVALDGAEYMELLHDHGLLAAAAPPRRGPRGPGRARGARGRAPRAGPPARSAPRGRGRGRGAGRRRSARRRRSGRPRARQIVSTRRTSPAPPSAIWTGPDRSMP